MRAYNLTIRPSARCLRFGTFVIFAVVTGSCIRSGAQDLQVRPCNPAENAVASSPEAVGLMTMGSQDQERPSFTWCESLHAAWLPDARIYRFHTRVDVDYSYTYTFVRATSRSTLWLIRSGRGLVQKPSPDAPSSLAVINALLATVIVDPDDDELASISNLYFFLLDQENRDYMSFTIAPEHAITPAEYYRTKIWRVGSEYLVSMDVSETEFLLRYTTRSGKLHIDSVTDDSDGGSK